MLIWWYLWLKVNVTRSYWMPASLLTTTGFVPFLTQVGTAWQKASTVALTLPFSGILVRRPKNQPRVNSKTRSYSRKQLWRRWSRLLLQENLTLKAVTTTCFSISPSTHRPDFSKSTVTHSIPLVFLLPCCCRSWEVLDHPVSFYRRRLSSMLSGTELSKWISLPCLLVVLIPSIYTAYVFSLVFDSRSHFFFLSLARFLGCQECWHGIQLHKPHYQRHSQWW